MRITFFESLMLSVYRFDITILFSTYKLEKKALKRKSRVLLKS